MESGAEQAGSQAPEHWQIDSQAPAPPPRWAPYNYAPGVWASADRAALMRSKKKQGDHDSSPIELPRRRLWPWIAGAIGALLFVILAIALAR
jgi:hypothetical protein